MGPAEHVPTFASYFPETALEDFDRAQRGEAQYALRKLCRGIAATDATLGISRWFQIDTLPDVMPEVMPEALALHDLDETAPGFQLVLAELLLEDPDFDQLGL